MIWTTQQEATLRAYSYLGAEGARDAIAREHGVVRSIHAVEAHASRISVSLRHIVVCPECRKAATHLNRQTGLCPLCTELQHVEEERAFRDLIEAEIAETSGGPALEAAKRAYDAARQNNSRFCRKHGLKPRSKRD